MTGSSGLNIFILFMTGTVFALTQLNNRNINEIVVKEEHHDPLPDLFHTILPPELREWHEYSDYVPIIPLGFFLLIDQGKHFFIFLYVCSLVYLFRSIAFSLTILPSPTPHCECEWEVDPETTLRGFLNLLYQEGCNDLIFSGHTSMMVISSLFLIYYHFGNSFFAKFFFLIYNLFGMCVIVGTRLHYSVDVFLGSAISLMIFFLNHPTFLS